MFTVVMPMGGKGSRFQGFADVSKPLIMIDGQPMFIRALSCLPLEHIRLAIFICANGEEGAAAEMYRIAGLEGYPQGLFLSELSPTGVAHCVQLAKPHIPADDPGLLIHHADQYIDWDVDLFATALEQGHDGVVPIWNTTSKEDWGFAMIDKQSMVKAIHPKKQSLDYPNVLCGCSYFTDASEYFSALAEMTVDDLVEDEIYVESAYNKMVNKGLNVFAFQVNQVHSMGTPQELIDTMDSGVFHDFQG